MIQIVPDMDSKNSFKDSLNESFSNENRYNDPDGESRRKDQDQARHFREKAVKILYITLSIELTFVAILLILQGFKWFCFHLHVVIFTVLVCGVMIQTFGLMVIVFKYLFGGTPYR